MYKKISLIHSSLAKIITLPICYRYYYYYYYNVTYTHIYVYALKLYNVLIWNHQVKLINEGLMIITITRSPAEPNWVTSWESSFRGRTRSTFNSLLILAEEKRTFLLAVLDITEDIHFDLWLFLFLLKLFLLTRYNVIN